jgi:uncharacterized protein DUF4386
MNPQQIARATGVLFLVTFATSIPALLLFSPILEDGGYSSYITGAGADNQIFLGATLEVLLILANVATAVVLFPILRRQNELLALGYVAARIVECIFIAVGVLSVLAIVTLRQDAAGADPATLGVVGQALVAVKDWTFLFGPGFVTGVGTGFILGYLMYSSGLVPRRLAIFGLVGGPLIVISGLLVLFGVIELGGEVQFLFAIPEIIWELSLGIHLTVKGFKPSPILGSDGSAGRRQAAPELAVQPA